MRGRDPCRHRFEYVETIAQPHVLPRGAAAEADELFGVGIRKRAQHDRVDHGEDRAVGADAECERDDGRERKRRRAAQAAYGKPNVLQEIGEIFRAPRGDFATLTVRDEFRSYRGHITKSFFGESARVGVIRAKRAIALGAHGEMKLELVVHVSGHVGAHQSKQSAPQLGRTAFGCHARAGLARSTRVTAAE